MSRSCVVIELKIDSCRGQWLDQRYAIRQLTSLDSYGFGLLPEKSIKFSSIAHKSILTLLKGEKHVVSGSCVVVELEILIMVTDFYLKSAIG